MKSKLEILSTVICLSFFAGLCLGIVGLTTPHWYSKTTLYGGIWKYCDYDKEWSCHDIDFPNATGMLIASLALLMPVSVLLVLSRALTEKLVTGCWQSFTITTLIILSFIQGVSILVAVFIFPIDEMVATWSRIPPEISLADWSRVCSFLSGICFLFNCACFLTIHCLKQGRDAIYRTRLDTDGFYLIR